MGTQTATESEFNVLQFEKQLTTLKDSQEAINTCCQWCLQNRAHHKKIVNAWLNVLKRVKVEQRLILFYLANDVVQYSKRRNYPFVESWGIALQKATTMVRDEKVKHKILRIFKIWEQRNVYNEEFISDLCGLLSVLPSAPKSDEPHEFQPNYVINKIKTCSKLEKDTDIKLKLLKEHNPKIQIDDGLTTSLKDRANVDDVEKEIEVYIKHMEDYINALKLEIKNRITLISVLKQAETQLEADRKDVKVVANAYKMFGTRVKTFQRKLEEHKETLSSPIPSPDVNAPSPSPDSDIDLPEEEVSEVIAPKEAAIAEYNPKAELQFSAGYYTPVPTEKETSCGFITNGTSSFIGSNFNLENFQNNLFGNTQPVSSSLPQSENSYATTPVQNPPLPVAAPVTAPLQSSTYGYGSSHMPLMPPPMPPFGKPEGEYVTAAYSYTTTASTTTYDNSYTSATTTAYETTLEYSATADKATFQEESFEPPLGANPYPPSEEYNPEEDVSTWEPDPSWNGGASVIPDTDTPESPPMFEKEGYSDPVEYHDTLIPSGAVDVDHRVVPGLSGDLEDSLGSLGGKDVDHRNLISLTGSPGNSSSNNPTNTATDSAWNQTDQDYRIPPAASGQAAPPSATTSDRDYRLSFNIEQLKLPPPPPPPPKTLDETASATASRLPAPFPVESESSLTEYRTTTGSPSRRNDSTEDMDMDMSDDEGRHKNNLKIIVDASIDQSYSLEPPPPLPNLPDDEDANNFLDDLSNDLHEFSNLSDDNSNTNMVESIMSDPNVMNQDHQQQQQWDHGPLMPPPPMMTFNDMVSPPMMPPQHMNTSIPPPPRPGEWMESLGNILMSSPPMMNPPPPMNQPPAMTHPPAMPLPPPPQPWMTEDEPPMEPHHYSNDLDGDRQWMNDKYQEEENWDQPAHQDYGHDSNWDNQEMHPPNEWLGPPPLNNNFGPFRGRGNNWGNFVKRGRGRGVAFNRGGNFRGGDRGGPRGGGRGMGPRGGPVNRGFFPRGNFRGNFRGGF
ncbi:uncharacterized protein isoform X2 [Leptinotarsa decemlineata]|uniref:uncharacterized protein isoform X2 n=1 Tax=Leptinotarsa decemlineata TaxID=7539 RepID=UPI003D30A6A3